MICLSAYTARSGRVIPPRRLDLGRAGFRVALTIAATSHKMR
jgi:hypothetical protein